MWPPRAGCRKLKPAMRTTTQLILASACALPVGARADDSAGLEFFEKRVRPVLVEHCYECHSAEAKKLKGKLRLIPLHVVLAVDVLEHVPGEAAKVEKHETMYG